jgi:hypothetical protein
MPYLIEATGYSDAAGGAVVFRWSNGTGYRSGPRDFPANKVWHPRIINPGTYERHCFGRGAIRGRSTVGSGEVVINNADGKLDALLDDVGFAGWPITIRRGPKRGRYPDDFPVVLTGCIAGAEFSRRKLTFRLRDRQALVADKLLVTTTYLGANSGGVGLEGLATDIKGQYKPQPCGVNRNVTLTWVNSSKLIAQAATTAVQAITVSAVSDKGAPLTPGGTYSTFADLQDDTKAPSAAQYKIYTGPEGTYVRFGSPPNGEPTADVIEGNGAADRTRGQLAKRILTGPGGEVEVRGVDRLDRQTPAVAGIYAGTNGLKIGDALDELLSDGIWWLPDRDGYFHLGLLEAPTGTPVATLDRSNILNEGEALNRIVGDDEGIPLYGLKIDHRKNWTVQDESALAGAAVSEKVWRSKPTLTTGETLAPEVARKWPLAETLRRTTIATLLDQEADANAERDRIMARDRVRRDTYEVRVWSTEAQIIDPADVEKNLVRIKVNRFGLNSGKLFRCIGMIEDLSRNVTTLYLWG